MPPTDALKAQLHVSVWRAASRPRLHRVRTPKTSRKNATHASTPRCNGSNIVKWIADNCPQDAADIPTCTSLEIYPKQAVASAAVRTAVQGWLDGLGRALTGADPGNPNTGVPAFLDVDATVDLILIEELSKNIDAYNLSLTLFRSDGGRAA